ncbi:MAG: OmpA family protein [Nitrospirota bacterium]
MKSATARLMYFIVPVVFGATSAMSGCSKKTVVATTTGSEVSQDGKPDQAKPAEATSKPLQGFSKTPAEEVIKAPAPIAVAKADQPVVVAAQRVLADIYFAFDKWALSKEGKKNLAQSAEVLKQNPSAKLLIEGHCDERGSREYNLVLGEKRAQETRRYLEALGIKNPVTITSFGKERPVCTEHNESCYWKNRRAHLVVEESK